VQPSVHFLISIYKPLLLFGAAVPFALLISSVVEQDARRRRFMPDVWAGINLTTLVLGIACVLLLPWFWLGFPLMLLLYCGALVGYWKYRDARLPPSEHFDLLAGKWAAASAARKARKALGEVTVVFQDGKGKRLQPPSREDPMLPVHLAAEQIVVPSLPARASRIDLIPGPQEHTIVRVVDTIRSKVGTLPTAESDKVIEYLKTAAGLDPKERRKRQVAILGMRAGDSVQPFRLTSWGTSAGQSLRIEHDRDKQLNKKIDAMGFLPNQLQALRDATDKIAGGVVIVAVPPGNGLTTLGLALVERHDPYTMDIKTVEKVVERKLEGVTHNEWALGVDSADYATTVQSVVRRGPNVLLVSDLAEHGLAPVLISANSANTIFYALVPAESGAAALAIYLKNAGDYAAAAKALRAVVAGRAIRVLCKQCRQPFEATPEQAKRLGAPAGKPLTLYKMGGQVQVKNQILPCPECQGSGFVGVTGAYEVMRPDERAVELLTAGDVVNAYQQMRRAHRAPTAQESALFRVRSGETSLEEVARAFAPRTPANKPAAGGKPSASARAAAPATAPGAPPKAPIPKNQPTKGGKA
jgi:type II secretory ATPase GspE/PulE/Tfp pilus assembly ATPase PilB-like protein